jgi:hypothetical protein
MDIHDGGLTAAELLKGLLAGIGAVAVWLLKKLGDKHIQGIEDLAKRIDKLVERADNLAERVTVVEVKENIREK